MAQILTGEGSGETRKESKKKKKRGIPNIGKLHDLLKEQIKQKVTKKGVIGLILYSWYLYLKTKQTTT